jgi:hypothetical protein
MEVIRQYISINTLIQYNGNDTTRKKIPSNKFLLPTTGGSKWSYIVVRMTRFRIKMQQYPANELWLNPRCKQDEGYACAFKIHRYLHNLPIKKCNSTYTNALCTFPMNKKLRETIRTHKIYEVYLKNSKRSRGWPRASQ